MKKIFSAAILLVVLGATAYVFRVPLTSLWNGWYAQFFPCQRPIAYRIGSFDARFGISRETFLKDMQIAEKIWEKPIDRELFVYRPDGELTVNLVYDYRQEATVKLRSLGFAVDESRGSYDTLKKKYEALTKSYEQNKASLDQRIKNFEIKNKAFAAEVARWNRQGGAPKEEYAALQKEQAALVAEADAIKAAEAALNATVDTINSLAAVLNRLGEALNLQVASYNQVGKERGSEFQEGLYQSGPSGQEIDIYQFDNAQKLVKVLAHELGHALGLEHVSDPKAIMYKYNQGTNDKLAADDLKILRERCGLPSAP